MTSTPSHEALTSFLENVLRARPIDPPEEDGESIDYWEVNGRVLKVAVVPSGEFTVWYELVPFPTQAMLEEFLRLLCFPMQEM